MAGRVAKKHPPSRPTPPPPRAEPDGLSDRERQIFTDLVRACDADHFTEGDLPLLVAYVQAVAQHERAVDALRRDGDVITNAKGEPRANPWLVVQEKCQRAMVALSMRLRLSPQARRERAVAPKRLDWMTRKTLQQEAEYE